MKLFALTLILVLAACDSGDGDDIQPIDAMLDGSSGGDGGGIDGATCVLPGAVTTCTVGNDAPCTALCASAFCHNFNQVGNVCTQSCSPGSTDQCPSGWTCNNMGRCRPPG